MPKTSMLYDKDPHRTRLTKDQAKLQIQGDRNRFDREQADRDVAGRPGYLSNLDEKGNIKQQYSMEAQLLDAGAMPQAEFDTRGIDEIRNRALDKGPSAWSQLAQGRQAEEQKAALDSSMQQTRSGQMQAEADMAMRGGLGGGSRASLAKASMKNNMLARQGVQRSGIMDRANIGLQDQTMKDDFLKQLPGADQMAFNAQANKRDFAANTAKFNAEAGMQSRKFNIENALRDRQSQSADNSAAWEQKMKVLGANKQARATENAGK